MKRVISIVVAAVICPAMAFPTFAAESDFVPSTSYKGPPDIVPVKDSDGNDAISVVKNAQGNVTDYVYGLCLVITPVSEANTSTLIPANLKEVLLDVYLALSTGMMKRYLNYQLEDVISLESRNVLSEKYYEFYADEDKLDERVLSLFYSPK